MGKTNKSHWGKKNKYHKLRFAHNPESCMLIQQVLLFLHVSHAECHYISTLVSGLIVANTGRWSQAEWRVKSQPTMVNDAKNSVKIVLLIALNVQTGINK